MNRKQILDKIIEHNLDQKWLQDELKAADKLQDQRNKLCTKIMERAPEWNYGSIRARKIQRQAVMDDILSKEAI
jgi:hypothetical protein